MLKTIFRYLLAIILGYIMITGIVYLLQKQLIYQSVSLSKDYQYRFENEFREINIPATGGETINGLVFEPESGNSKGLILYFHGNAKNLKRWGKYSEDFTALGYTVLMIDYSGYGKSTGKSSEEALYQNAEDTWNWAKKNLPSESMVIYGRSLGSAVASNLATRHKADLLILETPFYQLLQDHLKVFFPYGLKCEFPNYKNIPLIDYPIVIIQGTDDWTVTFKSAEKLSLLLKPNDRFETIEGGGHNNLRGFEEYHTVLESVLNN